MSVSHWLQDKRGNWSFTRVAPLACLVVAIAIWGIGVHWKELQGYCQQGTDKLLEFAKWAFASGKVSEEVGGMFAKKEVEDGTK